MKVRLKICRRKLEPYRHSINQCLKNTKSSHITWTKSQKLTKPKFNNLHSNFSNKKTLMKNKFFHLTRKTLKISKSKREILIFLSFNSKIIMKWKSKDWRRKFYRTGKNTSQARKILSSKFKKKWESNKGYIRKKSIPWETK